MAEELRFGEFNPDGSIKRDVRISALSGKRTEAGDPLIGIEGTPYFYRLEAQEFRLMNDEKRAEETLQMREEINKALVPSGAKLKAPEAPTVEKAQMAPSNQPGVPANEPSVRARNTMPTDKGVSNA